MRELTKLAFAKVNLALRILKRRDDGYHELDSVVAFADISDVLHVTVSGPERVECAGPFAAGLDPANNSVLQAVRALRTYAESCGENPPPIAVKLVKNLPIASGIGGGSADAAAALRAAIEIWQLVIPETELNRIALTLGADVPVCLRQQTSRMQGIGDTVTTLDLTLPHHIVLANPGLALLTKSVFVELGLQNGQVLHDNPLPMTMAHWHNDLEVSATRLIPAIGATIDLLKSAKGVVFAGMSGSGATCFGLFDHVDDASRAADQITRAQPNGWVRAGKLVQVTALSV
jgi:4-diphosphocytidyl-2-C-methyl-D-erythritol kinase